MKNSPTAVSAECCAVTVTVEHGNETKQTGEKGEQAYLFSIGLGRVAMSYYGGSGRKIGVFRE